MTYVCAQSLIDLKLEVLTTALLRAKIPALQAERENMSYAVAKLNQTLAEDHHLKVGLCVSKPDKRGYSVGVVVTSPRIFQAAAIEQKETVLEILTDCGIFYGNMAPFTYRLEFSFHTMLEKERNNFYQECPAFVISLHNGLDFKPGVHWEKPELIRYQDEWGYSTT